MRNSENYMITTGSEPLTTDDETTGPSSGDSRLRIVATGAGYPVLIYGGNTFSSSIPAFLLALMPVAVVVGVALHSLSTASFCIVRSSLSPPLWSSLACCFMADGLTYGIIRTPQSPAESYGMMMPFFRGRMGKLTLLLLALLVWLQYSLWFGKTDCTTTAG